MSAFNFSIWEETEARGPLKSKESSKTARANCGWIISGAFPFKIFRKGQNVGRQNYREGVWCVTGLV